MLSLLQSVFQQASHQQVASHRFPCAAVTFVQLLEPALWVQRNLQPALYMQRRTLISLF